MSLTFITYGMVKSLGNTFFIEQANGMSGGVPVVVFQIIQESSNIAATTGYKMVIERLIKGTKGRYSDGVSEDWTRYAGFYGMLLCCISGRDQKFFFLGAMEGLAGTGIQDFFGHYAPDSRRYGPVFANSVTGFGTVFNLGFIFILDYYNKSRYHSSWLGKPEEEEIPFLEVQEKTPSAQVEEKTSAEDQQIQLQKIPVRS
ncbi:putative oligopeptide transporter [Corchorus olitorius]|uniref:Oligopeptide transporter n=1 Tax=Corchorus olitorius TaxID=93759 RepID=A0A1R3HNV5_9ROSI|nr:putative oligopeptide transporter [Corchorus olitorius]